MRRVAPKVVPGMAVEAHICSYRGGKRTIGCILRYDCPQRVRGYCPLSGAFRLWARCRRGTRALGTGRNASFCKAALNSASSSGRAIRKHFRRTMASRRRYGCHRGRHREDPFAFQLERHRVTQFRGGRRKGLFKIPTSSRRVLILCRSRDRRLRSSLQPIQPPTGYMNVNFTFQLYSIVYGSASVCGSSRSAFLALALGPPLYS